ncbi:MAG: aromatic/alkene monooxygenase hydroxylase subunit beta [Panacagrimonas sp.]
MNIDLRTVTLEPLRQTFSHLERRFGNKPSSRYQEATYDIQAIENLHYRPTWDPEQKLYDPDVTRIVMKDWYALKDPRQFYYSTYTLARARQQDAVDADFTFIESRGLAAAAPDRWRKVVLDLLVPLRHAAWGANQNNMLACAYGYGVAFTQPCIMHAMDNLGIAQYLSRLGLVLGGEEALDLGKRAWTEGSTWQPLRRLVEDTMSIRDPVQVFVAQNLVIDGILYPMVYQRIVDDFLCSQGMPSVAMMCRFMSDWFEESRKWVDAVLGTMVAESEANRTVLQSWVRHYTKQAVTALQPIAEIAMPEHAAQLIDEVCESFHTRLKKLGLPL